MQQLTKQFTRDFSLYACEWWAYGLCEKFEKEVGRGNRDYIIVSDGKSVTSYYITADFELMKKALLDKLAKAPKWYYSISRKFRDDIDRTRAILEKIKRKKKTSGADARLLKDRHLLLFPMLRLSILIPAVLAEGIKKKVGGKIGKGIISDAYASRKYSDGVFEAIDYLLRELAGKKLRMLGKSNHYAKYLSESELIPLMDGKKLILKYWPEGQGDMSVAKANYSQRKITWGFSRNAAIPTRRKKPHGGQLGEVLPTMVERSAER